MRSTSEILPVYGGELYRSALPIETCAEISKQILHLEKTLGSVAFYTPTFRTQPGNEGMPMTKINKAWLSYVGEPPHSQALPLASFSAFNQNNIARSVQSVQLLAEVVDDMTLTPSVERCVQIYDPTGYMPTHKDSEYSVRLVNLSGKALVRWCSDEDFPQTIDCVELAAGDILHINGTIPHNVRAISNERRVMMGLIDS